MQPAEGFREQVGMTWKLRCILGRFEVGAQTDACREGSGQASVVLQR